MNKLPIIIYIGAYAVYSVLKKFNVKNVDIIWQLKKEGISSQNDVKFIVKLRRMCIRDRNYSLFQKVLPYESEDTWYSGYLLSYDSWSFLCSVDWEYRFYQF